MIKAGKLTFVCSGPKKVYDEVAPLLLHIGPGTLYVGEGELARIVLTEEDFSTLLVQQARASGIELKPENVKVGDGLG